ncbi:uncharacterized protein [Montipora capricornis]|uniref:uncharacterized protein n=1 Tax=Montipora capricornis TaxID=246305 RepID=UPI0035F1F231
MDEKGKEDEVASGVQYGKRPRLSPCNSPATSDLFDPDFHDKISEEKEGDLAVSASSPATNDLFEAAVNVDGDFSPKTSDLFETSFEDHERKYQEPIHGVNPLPFEHDDIGCVPLADSDSEDGTVTDGERSALIMTPEVVPLGSQADRKYKPNIDLSRLAPIEVHSFKCCSEECLRNMELSEILICRKKYVMMSQMNQKQWILDYLWDHTNRNRSLEGVVFIARGFKTCKEAWQAVYGISNKRLDEALKSIMNCVLTYDLENRFRGQRHKTNVSKAWMKLLFSRIGDKMPDSLAINLPSYLDYRILYGWMKQDLTGEEMICYSQFCRIMNSDFPDVSIPKVNRLTKCDICTSLKEEKQKTMDKTLRAYYDNLYKQHNDLQREEREKYYYHRGKARDAMSSKSYMCLIIDGMDQNKLLIPSLINQAKSYGSAWRLKTHLTGVINHGREVLAFTDVHQWGHDSNFTINILLRTLRRMQHIPDVLYLQMDNCWRENKNQFVIIFLAVLVKRQIFKKVKINFLMVGHTHEDIDQFFSKIAASIAKKNIRTLRELMELVDEAYTPCPHVEFVDVIYDVKSWLREAKAELHNITNPHCFVLRETETGNVVLKYKNWSRDKTWKPSSMPSEGVVVLESDKVPRGLPETVPPSSEKIDLKRLREDIPKFYSSRCFNQSHKEWWDDFLSDKEGVYSTPEDASTWLLDDIIVIKKRQHEPRSVDLAGAMISPVVEKSSAETAIEKLVADQLDDIPEVYAGAYKNPRVISSRVNKVTDHLSALKEDVFVAVNIEGYKKIPVLGKVRSVDASTFELEYWRGTWKTEWKPWKLSNGDTWTDILPKSCILLVAFVFDEKNKLPHETYKYLKETYKTLRGRKE